MMDGCFVPSCAGESERRMGEQAHRLEHVDVLVSGDQVGAFSDAGGRLQLVARQHPDLSRRYKEDEKRFCSSCCAQMLFFCFYFFFI